jgi:hypothetical protein
MAESENRRPSGTRENRSRDDRGGSAGRSRPGSMSPSALRELAEELEEHGRALIARARELKRMAGEGGGRDRPQARSGNRTERPGAGGAARTGDRRGGGDRERSRGGRGARGADTGDRAARGSDVPDRAPTPKRRKT